MHPSSMLLSLQLLIPLGESLALSASLKEPGVLLRARELCSNIRSPPTEDLPIHSDSSVLYLVLSL